ncbi:ABC transporter permease [Pseudodesulfovibrio sp.]|uniref:ABC transporter permease n=1 Tax=Pseudodesulfovibrio sp. TaxID=2035812 RepID=UPI002615E05E|nr:ABC transporter permease [Pseudodesulfovibrio sp.]MDD3312888.1 ABC transporter permease [Pseudodesulfovibrio sp.]
MILSENIQESLNSLWGAKQRSLLALIGIVIGIGSVIAMVAVGQIVENESIRQFREMGTDVCMVRENVLPGKHGKRGGSAGMSLADVAKVPGQCPAIRTVAPYVNLYSRLTRDGRRVPCPGLGVTGGFRDMFKVPMAEGRFISDLDGYESFCVLGHTKAEWLRAQGAGALVGSDVLFGGRLYTVVGVAGPVLSGSFRPYEINEGIMVPIRLALRLPDRPRIGAFAARMTGSGETGEATRQVKAFFRYTNRMNVDVVGAEDLVAQMERQMRMFTLMLGAIGSIALIVGGVGVMNVMLVSVSERRREIGIRRALGAERKDIQLQFLVESVVLSFVGGILGLLLGVGAVAVICRFTGWEFFVSFLSVLLGVGVSAAVGIFFGYYPARQAARLSPIDALRSE